MVLRNEADLNLPEGQTIQSFLWFSTRHIQTANNLFAWLGIIEKMPLESRLRAEADIVAPDGCLEVASRLWRLESKKPADERDWKSLVETLVEAATRAFALQMPLLGAAFTRLAATTSGEELQSFDVAQTLAQKAINGITDENAKFLIEDALGRAFAMANRPEDAVIWLAQAAIRAANRFPQQQMQALVCYAKALADSKEDFRASISACQRATEVATVLSKPEQARAWGELGIAAWRGGNWPLCAEALETAVLQLVKMDGENIEQKDDGWKEAFILLGHALGYIVSDALKHQAPLTADGEEYFVPFQTMLLGSHTAVARLYKPEKEILIWVQLVSLWSALEFDDRALSWALVGWEVLKRQGDAETSLATSALLFRLIPHWIENNDFAEALKAAHQQATDLVWSQAASERGIEMRDALSLQPVEEFELDTLGRQRLDAWIANIFLLPCAFRLAQIHLSDRAEAARHAQDVSELCRQYSQRASFPNYWGEVAELLSATYSDSVSHHALLEKRSESESDHLDNVFLLVGYLGASLKPEVALSDALYLHLLLMPHLDTNFLASSRIVYRRIVIRFCFDFWLRAFATKRAAFDDSFPGMNGLTLDQGLNTAVDLVPESGIKQLLMVLSVGLNVGGPPQAQAWLREWASQL